MPPYRMAGDLRYWQVAMNGGRKEFSLGPFGG